MKTMIKLCTRNKTDICCSGYQLINEVTCVGKYIYPIVIDKTYIPCSYFIFFFCVSNKKLQLFNVFASCDTGYNGRHCENRCAAPFYGFDCQFECKCEKEDCHYAEGCKETYKTGIFTNLSCMMNILRMEFVDFYGMYKICYEKS